MLQPWSSAQLLTLTSTLIIPDITKTEFNNCLISARIRPFYKFPREEHLHHHLEIINGTFAE